MKKSALLFILAISSFSICSCSSSTSDSLPVVSIEEAVRNIQSVNLSNYASEIEYIPLETADSALLGNIYTFSLDNNYIYIVSSNKQKTIHIFDKNGKYLKNVGSKGRAYGEYTAARGLIPLSDKNQIMVEGGNKAVIYSIEDGSVVNDIPFDNFLKGQQFTSRTMNGKTLTNARKHVVSIEYNNGMFSIIACDNKSGEQQYLKFDSDLNIMDSINLKKGLKIAQETNMDGKTIKFPPILRQCCTYTYNNSLNIAYPPVDTIYGVMDKTLVPRLVIDHGRFKNHDLNNDFILTDKTFWIIFNKNEIFETDKLLCFTARMPKPEYIYGNDNPTAYILYDKQSGKSCAVEYSNELRSAIFTNDIDNGMPFWPIATIGNKMYMFADAGNFIDMSKKYNSPQMKKVAAQLTEESNPVLIAVTVK